MAYIGDEGFLVNTELREGKQHSQKGTPDFLRQGYLTLPEARGSFDPRSKRPNSDAYMV